MASAGAVGGAALILPVFVPLGVVGVGYAGHSMLHINWTSVMTNFFTGPGRLSRILLLFFVLINYKTMPLAWTARVFGAVIRHVAIRPKRLTPRSLFHYSITKSHTNLLETDYNFHKSNSTYFADLDVSRSHLVMHLMRPGIKAISENAKTKLVHDKQGNLIKGGFGMGLGAVFCSFKKELGSYQGFEMWTRVLAWDRKWLYLVTHFVIKGKVKPTQWDDKSYGKLRPKDQEADFQKYVIATAVSKYVFKLGRFTVHPAIVLDASGLLPPRPGAGWRGGEAEVGMPDELGEITAESEWDWKKVESERRKGMEFAEHFAALDSTNGLFEGGEDGALGRFSPG